MTGLVRYLLALLLALASPAALASPTSVLVAVQGMDDECCADLVVAALQDLPFADAVLADPTRSLACVTLSGELDEATLRAKVGGAGDYVVLSVTAAEACPADMAPPARPRPWDDIGGLDAVVISRGEAVDLRAHRAEDRPTIFDFGAPWCPPCWTSAEALKAALRARPELAVRVVELEGEDAVASFATPAAQQHLGMAEGLPYFVALNAKGKVVYRGSDVEAALAASAR